MNLLFHTALHALHVKEVDGYYTSGGDPDRKTDGMRKGWIDIIHQVGNYTKNQAHPHVDAQVDAYLGQAGYMTRPGDFYFGNHQHKRTCVYL